MSIRENSFHSLFRLPCSVIPPPARFARPLIYPKNERGAPTGAPFKTICSARFIGSCCLFSPIHRALLGVCSARFIGSCGLFRPIYRAFWIPLWGRVSTRPFRRKAETPSRSPGGASRYLGKCPDPSGQGGDWGSCSARFIGLGGIATSSPNKLGGTCESRRPINWAEHVNPDAQ